MSFQFEPRPREISYDPIRDEWLIDGMRFSDELLRTLTTTPCGVMFRIIERKDGLITISQEHDPLALAAPEHMSAWITAQNAGYSFESLGEDMPGIRAAIEKTEAP